MFGSEAQVSIMKLSTCHAMVKTEALVAGGLPSTSSLFSKFGRKQLQGRQVGRVEFQQQQIVVGRSAMVRIRASGGKEVYQPFRPPVSTDPAPLGATSTEEQLEVLRDRFGDTYILLCPFASILCSFKHGLQLQQFLSLCSWV